MYLVWPYFSFQCDLVNKIKDRAYNLSVKIESTFTNMKLRFSFKIFCKIWQHGDSIPTHQEFCKTQQLLFPLDAAALLQPATASTQQALSIRSSQSFYFAIHRLKVKYQSGSKHFRGRAELGEDQEPGTSSLFPSFLLAGVPQPFITSMITFTTIGRDSFKLRAKQLSVSALSQKAHVRYVSETLMSQKGLLVISYCLSSKLQTLQTQFLPKALVSMSLPAS